MSLMTKMIARELLKERIEKVTAEQNIGELLLLQSELTQLEVEIINESYKEVGKEFTKYKERISEG